MNATSVYQPQGVAAPATETALAPVVHAEVRMGLDTVNGFEALQRAAKLLASAAIVPDTYRGKVADCAVALDISLRLGLSPILVMQNLYVVKGKVSWSGQFCIAVINHAGLFSPLDFEWKGTAGQRDRACRAVATRLADKKRLEGAWIDWAMIDAEGWASKDGSKWKSMPEQMFVYRAASFWMRRWFPEGLLGLPTDDEVIDITPPAKVVEIAPPAQAAPVTVEVVAQPAPVSVPVGGALEPGVDPVAMAPAPAAPPPAKKGLEATKERIRQAKERLAAAERPGPAHTNPPDDELGQRPLVIDDATGEE